jgi:hypothetical protein
MDRIVVLTTGRKNARIPSTGQKTESMTDRSGVNWQLQLINLDGTMQIEPSELAILQISRRNDDNSIYVE